VHGDTITTLLLVVVVAALSPLVADLVRRFVRLPGVVVEIVLGIIIGPKVLGWANLDEVIAVLAELGLVLLIFLAGYEVDLQEVRGAPSRLAVQGWLVSLVLGVAVAWGLYSLGVTSGVKFVAIALTTTAIGTLLPIVGDAGLLGTRFGTMFLAGGAVGEIGPIVAISVALTPQHPAKAVVVLVVFAAIAGLAGFLASRPTPPRFVRLIGHTLHTSGQLGVRIAVLLCGLLVWVASTFDLDVLLGAFAAGMIARLFLGADEGDGVDHLHEVQVRLESLGFGFFIPLFFVVSGMKFDLDALADPGTLLKVPMFLALFLVVRGLPVLLYRKHLDRAGMTSLAFLQSAALPLVVVVTGLGVAEGMMRPDNAAAMVGAGLLSVVVFPILGLSFHGRSQRA
jgi:Kef-type K+ transport system membrane component KefB